MEIAALLTLGGLGYLFNSRRAVQQDAPPPMQTRTRGRLPAGDVPSAKGPYESVYVDVVRDQETRAVIRAATAGRDSVRTGVIPRGGPERPQTWVHSRLTGQDMPTEKFTHMNMQPYFGGTIKQDTRVDAPSSFLSRYTGVQSQGEVPDAPKREIAPMFELRAEEVHGNKAAPDVFLSRMEAPRLRNNELPFEQQRVGPGLNRGYGTSGTVNGLYDDRAFAVPKDTDTLRIAGNAKVSYDGVIVPGGPTSGLTRAPTRDGLGVVEARRPERFQEYAPGEGMFTTVGAVSKRAERPEEVLRDTTRPATHRAYMGTVRATLAPDGVADLVVKSRVRPSTNAVLCGPSVGPAVRVGTGTAGESDFGRRNILIAENARDLTGKRSYTGNLAAAVKAMTAPLMDLARGPARDSGKCAAPRAVGNVRGALTKAPTYDPSDVLRTTIREQTVDAVWTTGAALGGASAGPRKLPVYDPVAHAARATLKQQLVADAQTRGGGGMVRGGAVPRAPAYDPATSAPRTTLKDQNAADSQARGGTAAGASVRGGAVPKPTVYDPETYAPRPTIKEQTSQTDARAGSATTNVPKAAVYDPETYAPRITIKEQTSAQSDSRAGAAATVVPHATVYDPDTYAPRTTLKEQTVSDAQDRGGTVVGGAVPKTTVYDPDVYAPRATLKEQGIHDGSGSAQRGTVAPAQYDGYTREPDEIARATGRETMRTMESSLNLVPSDRPRAAPARAADGSDVLTRTTVKEQYVTARNLVDGTSVGGLAGSVGGYQTAEYVAPTTRNEVGLERAEGYVGGVNSGLVAGTDGYKVAQDASIPRDTQRQELSDREYFGTAAGSTDAEMSRDSFANAEIRDPGRQRLLEGREPTLSGVKSSVGPESVHNLSVRHQDMTAAAEWTPPVGRQSTALPSGGVVDAADAGSVTVDKMVYRNQGDRLDDDVNALRSQMRDNPVALSDWAATGDGGGPRF